MKKIFLCLTTAVLLAGCGASTTTSIPNQPQAEVQHLQTARVVVDDGVGVATYSAELANGETALQLTQQTLHDQGIGLQTKSYSFGDLVETIGNKTNTADRAWIFYVNGKAADVGAGAYQVQPDDILLWKYEKPIY